MSKKIRNELHSVMKVKILLRCTLLVVNSSQRLYISILPTVGYLSVLVMTGPRCDSPVQSLSKHSYNGVCLLGFYQLSGTNHRLRTVVTLQAKMAR